MLRINTSPESLLAYKAGVSSNLFISKLVFEKEKLVAEGTGIYHAAFPNFGGTEDLVSKQKIEEFEKLSNKNIDWAYFSNNWYDTIQFPSEAVRKISDAGKVPFIRIMPRTNFNEGGPDPNYTMQKIIDGVFDDTYPTLKSLTNKPIAILEFAITEIK